MIPALSPDLAQGTSLRTLSRRRWERVAPDLQHVRQVLDPLPVRQPPPPLARWDQDARRVQQPPHLLDRSAISDLCTTYDAAPL